MTLRLALAGDTMLGRSVGERIAADPHRPLWSPAVVEAAAGADRFLLNLECCISDRGERWPDPRKPFFFRAPPAAAERLRDLGADAVTLANNHALDYGPQALLDTCAHLRDAGVATVGAGKDEATARRPLALEAGGARVTVVAAADHPGAFAAGPARPGIAYADLWHGTPAWLPGAVAGAGRGPVLVTVHWGPNMVGEPVPHVRRAAAELRAAGAGLVAGHSAHVFHGAQWADGSLVLYDLGDFVDDYAVDALLRNDLGLLWLVDVDERGPVRVEAVPLALDFCHTRLADQAEAAWIAGRLQAACVPFGTVVHERAGRLVVEPA